MGKQRKTSFFEIEPHISITPTYTKVKRAVCELIPTMNERSYMQGTFVQTMPQDLDFYERSVLKAYQEQNLMTLQ